MTESEEHTRRSEETIIGCDEMLVERDNKISRLEAEVRSLKMERSKLTPKRSPPLVRGHGQGGGAQYTPSKMEEELEDKKIQIERLSAKLEHSEHIINQMIQANTGGGGGGRNHSNHQQQQRHQEVVPQVRGSGKGSRGRGGGRGARRYMVAASGGYDDY